MRYVFKNIGHDGWIIDTTTNKSPNISIEYNGNVWHCDQEFMYNSPNAKACVDILNKQEQRNQFNKDFLEKIKL